MFKINGWYLLFWYPAAAVIVLYVTKRNYENIGIYKNILLRIFCMIFYEYFNLTAHISVWSTASFLVYIGYPIWTLLPVIVGIELYNIPIYTRTFSVFKYYYYYFIYLDTCEFNILSWFNLHCFHSGVFEAEKCLNCFTTTISIVNYTPTLTLHINRIFFSTVIINLRFSFIFYLMLIR